MNIWSNFSFYSWLTSSGEPKRNLGKRAKSAVAGWYRACVAKSRMIKSSTNQRTALLSDESLSEHVNTTSSPLGDNGMTNRGFKGGGTKTVMKGFVFVMNHDS